MEIDDYNPKAREAFGKSLVDIGVSIYKGIIILFTIVPITVILKTTLSNNPKDTNLIMIFGNMSVSNYVTLIVFLIAAFLAAHFFRSEGLKHIHESEGNDS
tara:strand:+ start:1532 stop:1834 length:303 start_codon:yes stop_codon:yes gene_type:complete